MEENSCCQPENEAVARVAHLCWKYANGPDSVGGHFMAEIESESTERTCYQYISGKQMLRNSLPVWKKRITASDSENRMD